MPEKVHPDYLWTSQLRVRERHSATCRKPNEIGHESHIRIGEGQGEVSKTRRNTREIARSSRAEEHESSARARVRTQKSSKSLNKSADSAAARSREVQPTTPTDEVGIDGQIERVVETLITQPAHDPSTGRFVRGEFKTFEHSAAFWSAVEPIKAEIVTRTRHQLAADDDDAPETLINLIDGYAEAVLLRKSAFARMCQQGGPVTSKGKTRGLLQAWGTFFDRELRAAERLGLRRRARRTQSPAEWLDSLDTTQHNERSDNDEPGSDTETEQAAGRP